MERGLGKKDGEYPERVHSYCEHGVSCSPTIHVPFEIGGRRRCPPWITGSLRMLTEFDSVCLDVQVSHSEMFRSD